MLNGAARAVGDGVVRTPRDGDIGAIFGFGFPPFRGGPLRHADDLGAARLVGELERLAERRSEEHTSELQSPCNLVCRLLLEKKKKRRDVHARVLATAGELGVRAAAT